MSVLTDMGNNREVPVEHESLRSEGMRWTHLIASHVNSSMGINFGASRRALELKYLRAGLAHEGRSRMSRHALRHSESMLADCPATIIAGYYAVETTRMVQLQVV